MKTRLSQFSTQIFSGKYLSMLSIIIAMSGCNDNSTLDSSTNQKNNSTQQQSEPTPAETARPNVNKSKPSSKLSPQAKKAYLRAPEEQSISGLAQLSASVDIVLFKQELIKLGGESGSLSDTTKQLAVTVPAGQLNELARIKSLVYFEIAQPYKQ